MSKHFNFYNMIVIAIIILLKCNCFAAYMRKFCLEMMQAEPTEKSVNETFSHQVNYARRKFKRGKLSEVLSPTTNGSQEAMATMQQQQQHMQHHLQQQHHQQEMTPDEAYHHHHHHHHLQQQQLPQAHQASCIENNNNSNATNVNQRIN